MEKTACKSSEGCSSLRLCPPLPSHILRRYQPSRTRPWLGESGQNTANLTVPERRRSQLQDSLDDDVMQAKVKGLCGSFLGVEDLRSKCELVGYAEQFRGSTSDLDITLRDIIHSEGIWHHVAARQSHSLALSEGKWHVPKHALVMTL